MLLVKIAVFADVTRKRHVIYAHNLPSCKVPVTHKLYVCAK